MTPMQIKPVLYTVFMIFLWVSPMMAKSLEKVSLQLSWLDQFQFAGYYMAKEKGFYKEAGFEVEIKKFQVDSDPLEDILSQKTTYGVGRSSLFIEKGRGKDVVLLAAILQSSPSILLARKGAGVDSIADFPGKKVMITGSVEVEVALQAMLNKTGNSFKDMTILRHSTNLNDLIDGTTDLMASYLSNEPYQLEKKGIEYVIYDPKEYGFDFYGDILFTSGKELKENRARTKSFVDASLRGWEYAFEHIEETAQIIYEKYNTQKKGLDAYIYEGYALKELAYFNGAKLGELKEGKLKRIYDIYNVMGLIEHKISIDDFYLIRGGMHKSEWSFAQREYLKAKGSISVCAFADFMPLHAVKEDQDTGMVSDYLKIIREQTGLKMTLIASKSVEELMGHFLKGACDLVPLIREDSERQKVMRFTRSYAQGALVIATTREKGFVANLKELEGKRIGIQSKTVAALEIAKAYPGIDLVEYKSNEEGLKAVNKGQVYGFLGDLFSASYAIQNSYADTMKISGRFGEDMKASMAVRKEDATLAEIIDKVLASVDEDQKRGIQQRWISVQYEEAVDYELMMKLIAVFVVITIFFAYRYQIMSKHNEQLRQLSIRDVLTQLYNRRYLDEFLTSTLRMAQRYKTPFAVILLDIDDFKQINDTYGHNEGDRALKAISKILSEHSRENDVVGRWGGEEFLIVCPHTTLDGARHLAEQLRGRIDGELASDDLQISASFGVAEYADEANVYKLITRADDALYEAKAQGKNRVVTG